MVKVNVGSLNPVKINASKEAFLNYFQKVSVKGINVESSVHKQPKSLNEIIVGSKNRAKEAFFDCDYSVGIEAGIFKVSKTYSGWMDTTIAIVYDGKNYYFGGSPLFEYPKKIIKKIVKEDKSVGEATEELTGRKKTGHKEGTIGILTKKVIKRKDLHKLAVIMALTRIVNKKLYD